MHEDHKKEETANGLTVLRREGDLNRLARWRSGALTNGSTVDHCGPVDPFIMEGSRQEVSVCGGRGWVEGEGGRRRRVGGAGGDERRQKWRAKEEKMGTDQRMPLVVDCPTCHLIVSRTHKTLSRVAIHRNLGD